MSVVVRGSVYLVSRPEDCISTEMALECAGFGVNRFFSVEEFIDIFSSLTPGCVVLNGDDLALDELATLQTTKKLHLSFPIIIIAHDPDSDVSVRARKWGVPYLVDRPASNEPIVNAVRRVTRRTARLMSKTAAPSRRLHLLSKREREVLERIVSGMTTKAIASELEIGTRTVDNYRFQVKHKMGARNIAQLVRLAMAAGIRPGGDRDP